MVKSPPQIEKNFIKNLEEERRNPCSSFSRGCGYSLPRPADIAIPMAARMKYLLRRAPYERLLSPGWQKNVSKIKNYRNCGNFKKRYPYGLDIPQLLKEMLSGEKINVAYFKMPVLNESIVCKQIPIVREVMEKYPGKPPIDSTQDCITMGKHLSEEAGILQ